jgi:hypothetical protein
VNFRANPYSERYSLPTGIREILSIFSAWLKFRDVQKYYWVSLSFGSISAVKATVYFGHKMLSVFVKAKKMSIRKAVLFIQA